jgi:hypothetical protein
MNEAHLQRLMHTCAWCTRSISPDEEFYGFGAKARADLDLSDKEGEFVSLNLALQDKTVVAMVATESSPVKAQGYDLLFVACSIECANELREALEFERDVFED